MNTIVFIGPSSCPYAYRVQRVQNSFYCRLRSTLYPLCDNIEGLQKLNLIGLYLKMWVKAIYIDIYINKSLTVMHKHENGERRLGTFCSS